MPSIESGESGDEQLRVSTQRRHLSRVREASTWQTLTVCSIRIRLSGSLLLFCPVFPSSERCRPLRLAVCQYLPCFPQNLRVNKTGRICHQSGAYSVACHEAPPRKVDSSTPTTGLCIAACGTSARHWRRYSRRLLTCSPVAVSRLFGRRGPQNERRIPRGAARVTQPGPGLTRRW